MLASPASAGLLFVLIFVLPPVIVRVIRSCRRAPRSPSADFFRDVDDTALQHRIQDGIRGVILVACVLLLLVFLLIRLVAGRPL